VLISGYSIVFFANHKIFFKYLLGFSGAVLLGLIAHHLLPEIYQEFQEHKLPNVSIHTIAYCLMGGFLIQLILDYFSHGVEHGHIHNESNKKFIPWGIFISLCIHAYLEGFPLENVLFQGNTDYRYLWAILIHKIPISMTLMRLLSVDLNFKEKWFFRKQTFLLFIFGSMAPLGAISQYFLYATFENILAYSFLINAVITGMLIHISTVILLETEENHRFNLGKLLSVLIGLVLSSFLF
jgi:zinc transporter ZupT